MSSEHPANFSLSLATRVQHVDYVEFLCQEAPMAFTDGVGTKIWIPELQKQRESIAFFATGARDLSMAECKSIDI